MVQPRLVIVKLVFSAGIDAGLFAHISNPVDLSEFTPSKMFIRLIIGNRDVPGPPPVTPPTAQTHNLTVLMPGETSVHVVPEEVTLFPPAPLAFLGLLHRLGLAPPQ